MSTAVRQQASTSRELDPGHLPRRINELMLRYCDAIEACRSVPALSVTPLFKLYFQFGWYLVCIEFSILFAMIDLPLLLTRAIFGRPHLVLGRAVYDYLKRPLRSIWEGEIYAFKIMRARYLTRLILYYHAQSRIDALHSAFNRRHLDILIAKPLNPAALSEAEELQKSFDLFQQVTRGSYRFGALAVGGPLVTLLSVFTQQAVLPGTSYLLKILWTFFAGGPELSLSSPLLESTVGFAIIFGIFAIWALISAWMDMRFVLASLDVREFERDACAAAKINCWREVPLDLIWYLVVIIVSFGLPIASFVDNLDRGTPPPESYDSELLQAVVTYGITSGVLVCFGLVALARRLWLARHIVLSA